MRTQRLAADLNPNCFSHDLELLLRSSEGSLAACRVTNNVVARLRMHGFVYVVARFPAHTLDSLTSRQRQVAKLAAAGGSLDDIADQLRLSRASIAKHLQKVYAKLQVHRRAALASMMVGLAL
jgi:DNA-binding NarL/FixJ family response regulator